MGEDQENLVDAYDEYDEEQDVIEYDNHSELRECGRCLYRFKFSVAVIGLTAMVLAAIIIGGTIVLRQPAIDSLNTFTFDDIFTVGYSRASLSWLPEGNKYSDTTTGRDIVVVQLPDDNHKQGVTTLYNATVSGSQVGDYSTYSISPDER
eukprot:CAMPEP_0119141896 /NCGR_PEP_ID=MMETSP1310-20130426/31763_1 /TAXON_ID=464262 /ORGANISM="Genus nov. species nov., Strain RCC2339" /LENGTH=149 /DNA_ID=CAMNT_0007133387 /DNA_START=46 /DNA_END=491 /DNA_ORIENTATION=+